MTMATLPLRSYGFTQAGVSGLIIEPIVKLNDVLVNKTLRAWSAEKWGCFYYR